MTRCIIISEFLSFTWSESLIDALFLVTVANVGLDRFSIWEELKEGSFNVPMYERLNPGWLWTVFWLLVWVCTVMCSHIKNKTAFIKCVFFFNEWISDEVWLYQHRVMTKTVSETKSHCHFCWNYTFGSENVWLRANMYMHTFADPVLLHFYILS